MTNDTATPEEIERDVDRTRADLDDTLDQLQERLSPDRLFSEALDYLKGPNGGWLVQRARANPIAAAMAVVGIAWLLLGGRGSERTRLENLRRPEALDSDFRTGAPDYV